MLRLPKNLGTRSEAARYHILKANLQVLAIFCHITLIDSRHTAFNSTALPGTMSQAQYTSMAIYNRFRYVGRDDDLNATLIIHSLTPGASTPAMPVPEPESWGMLLLGLASVGLLARHKRGAKLA